MRHIGLFPYLRLGHYCWQVTYVISDICGLQCSQKNHFMDIEDWH